MTLSSKYFGFLALWLALAAPVARAETSEAEQIQAALESWVVERAPTEMLSLDDPSENGCPSIRLGGRQHPERALLAYLAGSAYGRFLAVSTRSWDPS